LFTGCITTAPTAAPGAVDNTGSNGGGGGSVCASPDPQNTTANKAAKAVGVKAAGTARVETTDTLAQERIFEHSDTATHAAVALFQTTR